MEKRELKPAFILAATLFLVAVISYSLPAKTPEQPLRMMFQSVAGRVLFDHHVHRGDLGYGLSCRDCHHELKNGDGKPRPCAECHRAGTAKEPKTLNRADAFHAQCVNCHKEYDAGPMECAGCHIM